MQRTAVAKSALVLLFLPLAPRLGAQMVDEIRTANASGEPGQVVEVEVTASFTDPAYWFDMAQWYSSSHEPPPESNFSKKTLPSAGSAGVVVLAPRLRRCRYFLIQAPEERKLSKEVLRPKTDVYAKLSLIYGLTVLLTPLTHDPLAGFVLSGSATLTLAFTGALTLGFLVLAIVSVRRIQRSQGECAGLCCIFVGAGEPIVE